MYYQDIPRYYTAIAEWCACMVVLYAIQKEYFKSIKFGLMSIGILFFQILFLELTGNVSSTFWIPCMAIAIFLMYIFLLFVGNLNFLNAGYSCAKAFLLAEFIASLEWQIFAFFMQEVMRVYAYRCY